MHAINAIKVLMSEKLDRSQNRLLRHSSIDMTLSSGLIEMQLGQK